MADYDINHDSDSESNNIDSTHSGVLRSVPGLYRPQPAPSSRFQGDPQPPGSTSVELTDPAPSQAGQFSCVTEVRKSNEIPSSETKRPEDTRDNESKLTKVGRVRDMAELAKDRQLIRETIKPEEQLTEFIYFPKLPIEIRCKIWKHTCFQEPQNIGLLVTDFNTQIHRWGMHKKWHDHMQSNFTYEAIYPRPHPAILHTSRESRTKALRYFKLDFGVQEKLNHTKGIFNSPPTIYVNWQNDTLVLVDPRAFGDLASGPFKDFVRRCRRNKAKFVAFNATGLERTNSKYNKALTNILQCSIGLQEIILFVTDVETLKSEHLRRRGTKLDLEALPLPFRDAFCKNGGDILWRMDGKTKHLRNAKRLLRESFQRHKDQLRRKIDENDIEGEIRAFAWKQPVVTHGKIHLNLLNKPDNRPGASESNKVILEY